MPHYDGVARLGQEVIGERPLRTTAVDEGEGSIRSGDRECEVVTEPLGNSQRFFGAPILRVGIGAVDW
jgi:hypothetical protein